MYVSYVQTDERNLSPVHEKSSKYRCMFLMYRRMNGTCPLFIMESRTLVGVATKGYV